MTLNEAKDLKSGQKLYYLGLDGLPEAVMVDKVLYNSLGHIEVHLVENCYVPEKELQDFLFLTFEECAQVCEKFFKKKLDKLKEMLQNQK